jgi:hypothetical protein
MPVAVTSAAEGSAPGSTEAQAKLDWQRKGGGKRDVPGTPRSLALMSRKTAPTSRETAPASFNEDVSTISASNLSLHDLFAQQARHMLERADLNEEQKQTILVAMSCPCCGAGGMSFSVKLKPE